MNGLIKSLSILKKYSEFVEEKKSLAHFSQKKTNTSLLLWLILKNSLRFQTKHPDGSVIVRQKTTTLTAYPLSEFVANKQSFVCSEIKVHLTAFILSLAHSFLVKSSFGGFSARVKASLAFSQSCWLKKSGVKTQIFYGHAYDDHMTALSFFLTQLGVNTEYYNNVGIPRFTGPVAAKRIFYRTIFQKRYHDFAGWRKFSEEAIASHEVNVRDTLQRNVFGVYTSGFLARLSSHQNRPYCVQGVVSEAQMISDIRQFALSNPGCFFRLYIHRNGAVESDGFAKLQHAEFLRLPNVELAPEGSNSLEEFSEIDVAITCVSEIFFDRLEAGLPAVLSHPFELDFVSLSGLKDFCAYSSENLSALLYSDLSIELAM